jgi:cytochrome c-type biogenesis protein CcmH/NrfG
MTLFWMLIFVLLGLALLFIILPLHRHLSTRSDYFVLISVCVCTIILSLGLYLKQGSSGALRQSIALQQRAVHLQALFATINNDPQKAITMMKAYLKNKPEDKHAWYLLGKLYQSIGDAHQAKVAFQFSLNVPPT